MTRVIFPKLDEPESSDPQAAPPASADNRSHDRSFPRGRNDLSVSPSTDEVLRAWRSQVLLLLLRGAVMVGALAVIAASFSVYERGQGYLALVYMAAYAILAGVTFLKVPYWLRAAFFLLVLYGLSITNMLEAGLRGDARLFLLAFCVMGLVFFGRQGGWVALSIAVLTLAVGGVLILGQRVTLLVPNTMVNTATWVAYCVVWGVLTYVIMQAMILLENFMRKALHGEYTFRRRLVQEQQNLERRVQERTQALQANFQISQKLATLQDPETLVVAVTEDIRQAFNYYHVHVYLLDEDTGDLLLVGGTGEAGRALMERHHRMAAGRGLVGRAAQSNRTVLVPDTLGDMGWLPNPLLPETRSEIAAPIAVGDQVLGVLDVQSSQVKGLNQQDADLLSSVANQLGVALQNARQFMSTQRIAGREALANQILQRLQAASTVDDLLQLTVRELGTALNADRTQIGLNLKPAVHQEGHPSGLG